MINSKIAYLVCVAGNPNLGDEWIAYSWVKYYSELGYEVIVDCPNPSQVQKIFPALAKNNKVSYQNNFWAIAEKFKHMNLYESKKQLYIELSNEFTDFSNIYFQNKEKKIYKKFHILGGGYVNELWNTSLLVLHTVSFYAKRHKAKVTWTGASCFPLSDLTLFDHAEAISNIDAIFTRDVKTFDLLNKVNQNVHFGVDDVYFGLREKTINSLTMDRSTPTDSLGNKDHSDKPLYFINLQRDLFSAEHFASTCLALLQRLRKYQCSHRLVYLEAIPGVDTIAYKFFVDAGITLELVRFNELIQWSTGDAQPFALTDNCYVTSSRFHLHLWFSAAGVAGEYICANDYYDNKHGSLLELGTRWRLFDAHSELNLEKPTLDYAKINFDLDLMLASLQID